MSWSAELEKPLKYIMVQLPENLEENLKSADTNSKKLIENGIQFLKELKKPLLITELAKERIRRAAKKIKEELQAKQQQQQGKLDFEEDTTVDISKLDFGFRVYRLDSSNMQDVYYRPQEYKQEAMELFADNIKADRTPDDLLAQVMLDWGLPLSLKIEQQQLQGKLLFKVAGNSLYACFDDGIDEAFAKAVAPEHPLRMVFRDKGFSSDTAKVNVKQLLKQLSPETEMKVI
jgi:adenine-specific DNA-methyltransferase